MVNKLQRDELQNNAERSVKIIRISVCGMPFRFQSLYVCDLYRKQSIVVCAVYGNTKRPARKHNMSKISCDNLAPMNCK